jgi:hypothetical protein
MSDQIDPAFKAAYRETQGQPVDAVGRAWDDKDDDLSAAVLASHPVNSKRHDTYERAMDLVGNRHSKSALVALVNHLLIQTEDAEKDARIAELLAADEVRASDISRLTIERDEARAECEGLRAALLRAKPYVDCAVHDDGGIDNCDIAYRMDLEAIDAILGQKETGDE